MVGLVELMEFASDPEFANNVIFFSFFSFTVLEQLQEGAREGKKVELSLLILQDQLWYACIYVQQGYIQKPPFILCDKLQHEARKH